MNIEDVEKLIGGYATGTLTKNERRLLMDAAMTNQALFDALADEEELRELLSDPASRRELLAVLQRDLAPVELVAAAAAAPPSMQPASMQPAPMQAARTVAPPASSGPSLWDRLSAWLFQPIPMAAFGTAAVAIVALLIIRPGQQKPMGEIAQHREQPSITDQANGTAAPRIVAESETKTVAKGDVQAPGSGPVSAPALSKDQPVAPATPVSAREEPATQIQAAPPVLQQAPQQAPQQTQSENRPQAQLSDSARQQVAIGNAVQTDTFAVQKKAEDKKKEQDQDQLSRKQVAPSPATPPPGAVAETGAAGGAARARSDDAKTAAKTAANPVAAPAFRYGVERKQADGTWVEFGGELLAGDEARIRITSLRSGYLALTVPGSALQSLAVESGQTYYFPAGGSLPSGQGERLIRLAYFERPLEAPESQGRVNGMLRSAKRKSSANEQEKSISGGQTGFEVTVRLRYR